MDKKILWYNHSIKETFGLLKTRKEGLKTSEVKTRIKKYYFSNK